MKTLSKFVLIAMLLVQYSLASGSEFIEDMPELKQDPDRPGAMIWMKPGVDRAEYRMVMIEPITIFISPDSKYKGLSTDDLQGLAHTFAEAVTRTLEPEVPIVSQAGPGVIYLRAALTDVEVVKKKRGLLGYTPIGLVAGAVKSATVGPSVSLKNAALEIEMIDPTTQERVGVLVDKAPTEGDGELSWDSISKTFEFYAVRFKARMQAARE